MRRELSRNLASLYIIRKISMSFLFYFAFVTFGCGLKASHFILIKIELLKLELKKINHLHVTIMSVKTPSANQKLKIMTTFILHLTSSKI